MPSRVRAALLVTLGAGALLNVALALALIVRPDEVRYGEAIIYDQAARLLHGQSLYQPLDQAPYTVTAYTPLYYWLVAILRLAFGPGFGPGRALSFAAGLVAAALVGYVSWRRTRAVWPPLAGSLLFLGLGLVGPIPWFASYKEDVLGVALSLGAIAALEGGTTRSRVSAAAVLAALAMLSKQTMVPAALSCAIWLVYQRPRLAGLFVAIVATLLLGPLLLLELTSHALLANVVLANVNPFSTTTLEYNLTLLALFQTAPLLVALPYVVKRLRLLGPTQDLVLATWLTSIIPVLGLAKEGADYNYWQLFAALSAIIVAIALWERRHTASGAWSAVALSANALGAVIIIGTVAAHDPWLRPPEPGAATGFTSLVARARLEPHPVFADPLDVSALADRSIVLEPVIYNLFYQAGQWDAEPIVEQVCSGQISLLVLGYPLGSGAQDGAQAEHRWPAPVLAAFRRALVLREVVPLASGQRYVYAPDATQAGCAAAGRSL